MQRRLLAETNLNLKKACELAQGMEPANRNAKEIQAKGSAEGLVHSIKGRSQKVQFPVQDALGWVILLKIAGVVVQVVPPSKCPPGQSALVQDVPPDSLP